MSLLVGRGGSCDLWWVDGTLRVVLRTWVWLLGEEFLFRDPLRACARPRGCGLSCDLESAGQAGRGRWARLRLALRFLLSGDLRPPRCCRRARGRAPSGAGAVSFHVRERRLASGVFRSFAAGIRGRGPLARLSARPRDGAIACYRGGHRSLWREAVRA